MRLQRNHAASTLPALSSTLAAIARASRWAKAQIVFQSAVEKGCIVNIAARRISAFDSHMFHPGSFKQFHYVDSIIVGICCNDMQFGHCQVNMT